MVAKEGLPKAKAAQLYEVRSLWLLCGATALSEGGGYGGENTRLSISCRAATKVIDLQKKRRKRYTSLLPAVLKSWAIFGRCKGLSLQKTIPAILANPNMRSKAQSGVLASAGLRITTTFTDCTRCTTSTK